MPPSFLAARVHSSSLAYIFLHGRLYKTTKLYSFQYNQCFFTQLNYNYFRVSIILIIVECLVGFAGQNVQ